MFETFFPRFLYSTTFYVYFYYKIILYLFSTYFFRFTLDRKPSLKILRSIENLPFPTFCRTVVWRNSTPRITSLPKQGNENIKYFISSSRNRTHNLSSLLFGAIYKTTIMFVNEISFFILNSSRVTVSGLIKLQV